MEQHFLADAYPPAEIARKVESLGVAKAKMGSLTLFVLAVLAGAFVSIGAIFFTVVMTGSTLGFGVTRLLGGVSFSLGLILVVVAGAELFTGNNLLAMAWASGLITTRSVARNWAIAYAGNVIGCLATVAFVFWANIAALAGGGVGETALQIALSKSALTLGEAFARGVLCNALVCLAIWLAMGGRSVIDKIWAIIFPITAFVALGGWNTPSPTGSSCPTAFCWINSALSPFTASSPICSQSPLAISSVARCWLPVSIGLPIYVASVSPEPLNTQKYAKTTLFCIFCTG